MNRSMTASLIRGVGLGAALMYFLDPVRGARRRALARGKIARVTRAGREKAGARARDLANRARGVAAEARSRVSSELTDPDVLVARVRSELGRIVSHPGAIDVTADGGRVILDGHVLESEAADAASRIARVRGVTDVLNRLRVHATAEGVPALQGGWMREARYSVL